MVKCAPRASNGPSHLGLCAPAGGKDTNDGVHLFNNEFINGRNNAIIGVLSGSVLQGNTFVYNHHVACFNQSGGQMCLNNARMGQITR